MEARNEFSKQDAKSIALTVYGIKASAKRLDGECDFNFLLETEIKSRYILKISATDEDRKVVEMQNFALEWLDKANQPFQYPELIATMAKDSFGIGTVPGKSNLVRLFQYVPGILFNHDNDRSDCKFTTFGTRLGELTNALQGFKHEAVNRYLKWDLKQAAWIQEHLPVFVDADQQSCVANFLETFNTCVKPMLHTLRKSVIHGDVNTHNTLVMDTPLGKPYVSGFIDFGDMVETPTICELAIGMTYAMMEHDDPFAAARMIVSHYHKQFPLQEAELDILFDLICIRLCISVTSSALRKQAGTADAYALTSEGHAWRLLNDFKQRDRCDIAREFKTATIRMGGAPVRAILFKKAK